MPDQIDLLSGYAEISAFLGWPLPTVRRRALDGIIPTFKPEGCRTVCARRSTLTAWLAAQEARGLHKGKSAGEREDGERAA